ncbi:hypothetical protein [Asanoa iriomotensis]|uniref:Uncharacterized protein n=1 Tax=Asanoa iriomotensis TaxID=234613 RepID=A0ABQ4C1I0_9ACTN|nr:hypothetical protein [Asanoa iriomotensis]GIF56638.1 hypothetical protein Air01nite_27330 [Asanoa iriomotensis]
MSSHRISLYHNLTSPFVPYSDSDWLTGAITFRPLLSAHTSPDAAADWAFNAFNTDRLHLASPHTGPVDAESLLAIKVYRLVRLPSLAVGDVAAVAGPVGEINWLACDLDGWRPITRPHRIDGEPLDVDVVRPFLRGRLSADLEAAGEAGGEMHRLCVFELFLSCGHIATVARDGWYPVSVACCDRLGGIVSRGDYIPFASEVEGINLLSERYGPRPGGARRKPGVLLRRRPRTDDPYTRADGGACPSAGRFPARVGAPRYIPVRLIAEGDSAS